MKQVGFATIIIVWCVFLSNAVVSLRSPCSPILHRGNISPTVSEQCNKRTFTRWATSTQLDAKRKRKRQKARSNSMSSKESLPGRIAQCVAVGNRIENDKEIDGSPTDAAEIVIIVDSNNVRGVDGFQYTNSDFVQCLSVWSKSMMGQARGSSDKPSSLVAESVLCVIDHGRAPGSFTYDGMTMVFAGPHQTADDVISNACQWFSTNGRFENVDGHSSDDGAASVKCNILVVTNDRELRTRCQRHSRRVSAFSSMHLINLLKESSIAVKEESAIKNDALMEDLLDAEAKIRIYESPAFYNAPNNLNNDGTDGGDETNVPHPPRSIFGKDFREKTWHRVVTAEIFRTMLTERTKSDTEQDSTNDIPRRSQGIVSRYQAMYNTAVTQPPISLLRDRRISNDNLAKQSIVTYLTRASSELSLERFGITTGTESSPSKPKPHRGTIAYTSSNKDSGSDDRFKYAKDVEQCDETETPASFLRSLIEEGRGAWGVDEIITLYKNLAPPHLQMKRSRVRQLLKKIAIKCKRSPDYVLQWNFKQKIIK